MIDALQLRQNLSTNRVYLMGISILWIVFHHVGFFGLYNFSGLSDFVIKLGSCGVDIFLVLSSFGLYNSLNKNFKIWHFYKRRIVRIIPPFVFIILGFHVRHLLESLSVNFWINELMCNWYIGFIIIAYLFYPLIFLMQKKLLFLPFLLGSVIGFVGTILLIMHDMDDIHQVPMLMTQRIPVFCLGSLVADDRFKLSWKNVSCSLGVIMVALYFSFVLNMEYLVYPLYLLLMIPLFSCLSHLLDKMLFSKLVLMKWGGQFLKFLGTITLELYLVHMKVLPILVRHNIDGIFGVFITFISSILLAYFVRKILSLSFFEHYRARK